MLGRRYLPAPGFEAELLRHPVIGEILQPRTAEVASRAKELTTSRSVAAGIGATVGLRSDGKIVGRVVAEDFKSGWFEFGTSRIPAQRMMARALEEIVGPIGASSE